MKPVFTLHATLLRPRPLLSALAVLAACGVGLAARTPAPSPFAALSKEYQREIRPLMKQYCLGCHSTAKKAGELDLERFSTLAEARRGAAAWTHVVEMLESREMPPKGAKQPTQPQRAKLVSWVQRFLDAEARSNPGDPGPVVLRRLNNAEYTYTVRDLTGIPDLDPAREFPSDSAAGEGFTNTGASLVMSPAMLTKYLDAGKEIADHSVLLPNGFRFSRHATRADWTNELLDDIRSLYARYSDSSGAETVNLQGIVFNTNEGGRLPVERYLSALLAERQALQSGVKTVAAVAAERKLSARYLGLLWTALNEQQESPLLDSVRAQWRAAKPDGTAALAANVSRWQKALWKFNTVGQIGRSDGPKSWQEAVSPLAASRELRVKLPDAGGKDVSLFLSAGDAGDGPAGDFALWSRPRLVTPGRPDVLLRDLRDFSRELTARRERLHAAAAKALAAADAASRGGDDPDLAALAREHQVDRELLTDWLDYLGIGVSGPVTLSHFKKQDSGVGGHAFINGWSSPDLPSLVANSSNQAVRIPGNVKPGGVCVHPTPALNACVGWESPIADSVRIEGVVTHAHPECGNGVTWAVELRRGTRRQRLAAGVAQGAGAARFAVDAPVAVRKGDLVSLVIGPRNNDHSCDLTDLELILKPAGDPNRTWSLTADVAKDVLAGNPHADRFGNPGVWHFYSEPVSGADPEAAVPPGSLLARWQSAATPEERRTLAQALEKLLAGNAPADAKSPDAALYRQLSSLNGPLLSRGWRQLAGAPREPGAKSTRGDIGLDPALFGRHPRGGQIDPVHLCVQAPSTLEVRVPAELAVGAELVTGASLSSSDDNGSVQMQVFTARPDGHGLSPDAPILAADGSPARKRFEQGFAEFRALFPSALCYPKIVPVDEVVTLILFYREDEPLQRLMLTDREKQELDRLWTELEWVSQKPLKQVTALEQIREFATQDRPDLVPQFDALREPVKQAAEEFQRQLAAAEPRQVGHLLSFASKAYRRPLTARETADLRALYQELRGEELSHEEAFRLILARIFTAPAFLYRLEEAPGTAGAAPVSDWELASRMSYFLWSSAPDDALRAAAASGTLRQPKVLSAQLRRMLKDPKIRRLATEFACQWLNIYEFDALDEKSERHFPEFAALRGDMYEEAIRFFTDLFQSDASVVSIFDADHTFVNARLAKFYGLPETPGLTDETWRRVDGVRKHDRGGILGLAATLAKQSGASRSSPILRGTWVSEVLLGERLPRPPKDVPQLPDEVAVDGLTVRELTARHVSDPRCSGCHARIDPFGFSLEGFDAIGRRRTVDAGKPVDTKTRTPDGKPIEGLAGLRAYLLQARRDQVLGQFYRKLLGYSLGRAVQLSDEPLLTEMERKLAANGYRFSTAAELIVQSRQFRYKRN
ncbi:MAG: DUF1592 domain-containing protein [Armatimonadota bacterium]